MELKQIINEHGFTFNKQFGQNFISDTNLLNAIVSDAKVSKGDTVIEIGAGAGGLTRALASQCQKVIAFEIDNNLKPILTQVLADYDNIDMMFGDFMKMPMNEVDKLGGKNYHVVANLPYYITTPLIMKFIEESINVSSLTLMVQKEVAERLVSKENCKEYGAVTVAVQSFGDVTITRNVSRKMFFPEPNVDSAIVRIAIDRNKYDIIDRNHFRKTVKSAFSMRRKTLQNNLLNALGIDRETTKEILRSMCLKEDIRGEVLSVTQFVQLDKMIASKMNAR